jgi:hypothetical protein
MNAFVPWYSFTSKSVSKLSVMVSHGIVQPIRAFRRSMSRCGAREANASGRERADLNFCIPIVSGGGLRDV